MPASRLTAAVSDVPALEIFRFRKNRKGETAATVKPVTIEVSEFLRKGGGAVKCRIGDVGPDEALTW